MQMKVFLIAAACTAAVAYASPVFAQGMPKGAEAGCDTACRAAKANPRPKFVSPEVGKDGRVTVRIFAPKANSIAVIGLQPLNQNGESEFAPATKGEDGIWAYVSPPRQPGTYAYSVRIDGVDAYDPSNLWVVHGRLSL